MRATSVSPQIRGNRHFTELRPMTENERRRFAEIRLYYYLRSIHQALEGSYIVGQFLEILCMATNTPKELIKVYYDEMRRGVGRPTLQERILFGAYHNLSFHRINTQLRVRYEAITPFFDNYFPKQRDFVVTRLTKEEADTIEYFCDTAKRLITSVDLPL